MIFFYLFILVLKNCSSLSASNHSHQLLENTPNSKDSSPPSKTPAITPLEHSPCDMSPVPVKSWSISINTPSPKDSIVPTSDTTLDLLQSPFLHRQTPEAEGQVSVKFITLLLSAWFIAKLIPKKDLKINFWNIKINFGE